MIIAIDGPAGAGKSTVAKTVAEKLGILYLDTGAMYRAFTLYVLKKDVPLEDKSRIYEALKNFNLKISKKNILVNGEDVTREIRSAAVDENVSYISSLDFVREKMVELQRKIAKNKDLIAEGRDIGTVVFPGAEYKFYLDAEVKERANRRLNDERSKFMSARISDLVEKIKQRDNYDSTRKLSPLKRGPDAYYIDSTNMDIDKVCSLIYNIVTKQE